MNEDRQREINLRKILQSLSYRVAYKDVDFLMQPELRAARMELELLKPELYFQRNNIRSTVVLFGSTRIVEPAAAEEQLERARAPGRHAQRSAPSAGGRPGRGASQAEPLLRDRP